MTRVWILAACMLAMAIPVASSAQEAAPACAAPGTLPPELSAWSMLAYRDAAASPATLPAARLTLGETARVTLLKTRAVTFAMTPAKPAAADSYGGLLQLVVSARGTYRVVLGTRAWIDVVSSRGAALESIAHSMGPACTGIRKMVDFTLDPGSYTIQLSGSADPAASVLVIRLP